MKLVSFNTNSIRTRLHQLEAVVERHAPEVIGIQETKVTDDEFPVEAIEALGYHATFFGQKTHYGVALLSKQPPQAVRKGLPGEPEDAQRRFIEATYDIPNFGPLTVMNGYFPQGENRDHPTKFPNKAAFYAGLDAYLDERLGAIKKSSSNPFVIMGDMNIAPLDADIGIGEDNRKRWLRDGKTSFLPEEREWLAAIQAKGFDDSYRLIHPDVDDRFSWFDYRSKGFEREPRRGLRIDLILTSRGLSDQVIAADVDYDVRAMERPSDHCPIWTEFK
ncbi:MAG: exodeoxyribonuclease III [Pseudomonadales bacterium]|jgi:exodeoxyribonuclease-3